MSITAVATEAATVVRMLDRDEWCDVGRRFADYSYRQSWAYAQRMASESGSRAEFVAIERGGATLGAASVRLKLVPLLGGGVAYVPGGPLVRRWGEERPDPSALGACLEALIARHVRGGGRTLRLQFPLCVSDAAAIEGAALASGLKRCAANPSYRTMAVNLGGTLEEIRSRLHQKWRNQLNAGSKKNISIDAGQSPEQFSRFGVLFNEMLDRKGFDSRVRPELFADIQSDAHEQDRTTVLLAKSEGVDVAGIIVSFLGDTPVYLLGATGAAGMQLKAAYVLQWEAIRIAKGKNCRLYDLGGIDPEANPGVHHFKEGLGGTDVSAVGPLELEPGGLRGAITALGERTYKKLRALRARRSGGAGP